jgi:hypothetical protein
VQTKPMTEDEIRWCEERMAKIERLLIKPAFERIDPAVEAGLERWEIAEAYLLTAFLVIGRMEQDHDKVMTAKQLARTAKVLRDQRIAKVLEDRRKAASAEKEAKNAGRGIN